MGFRKDDLEAIVMSAFDRNAGWLRNLEAPTAEVVVGALCFAAAHRVLDEEEATGVIAGYQKAQPAHRTRHPRGVEPPLGLALPRVGERSPPARRLAAAHLVPAAIIKRQTLQREHHRPADRKLSR
jgi:hypothetical protein